VDALHRGADGFLDGLEAHDAETGERFRCAAKVVINAAGPFVDSVRRLDNPGVQPMIAPSQGIHLVFDGSFLPGGSAIMVPHTSDGRVMFAIPWHGHTLVGTTDTPIEEATLDPEPFEEEIEFILITASQYLAKAPQRADILASFVGIRPLVRSAGTANTSALSRDHTIHIDPSGLLTVTGGKWTTYRHMAEDCVNQAALLARLDERDCVTKRLNIHGYHQHADRFGHLRVYGSDAPAVEALGTRRLHPELPYTDGEIRWAIREEMARTVEDILSRRTRASVLNAKAARELEPEIERILSEERAAESRSGGPAS
jgi:glycerol-3-phosphate dehydrogenase